MTEGSTVRYKRVLLKLSGEALKNEDHPVCEQAVQRLIEEIKSVQSLGVEVAIVIGGGNWARGRSLVDFNISRYTADQMGMLFTVANGLLLRDRLEASGVAASLMSPVAVSNATQSYHPREAIKLLEQKQVLIFVYGVGTPLFTTDSAASLRAIEIKADAVLKASTVDGIYSDDPKKNPDAKKYSHLNYQMVIEQHLQVMDMTAFCLCEEHNMPICVFSFAQAGALLKLVCGEDIGTIVDGEKHA